MAVDFQDVKRRADLQTIREHALRLWRGQQKSILWHAADVQARLAAGGDPAAQAARMRSGGTEILANLDAARAKLAQVQAALADLFTAEEVEAAFDLLAAKAAAMRDTPADGSGLTSLLDDLQSTLSEPDGLF